MKKIFIIFSLLILLFTSCELFLVEIGGYFLISDEEKGRVPPTDETSTLPGGFIFSDGKIKGYNGTDTDVVIPSEDSDGNPIISIESRAFENNNSITSVVIPDSVINIGDFAFTNCNNLESIVLGANVESIESNIFHLCDSLTEIEVDDLNAHFTSDDGILYDKNKTELIKYPASKSPSVETFTIPTGVTIIGNAAFQRCSSLTNIIIPDSVTSIEVSAFSQCSNLLSVRIPDRVTSIGSSAFNLCSNLRSVVIPESVISIEPAVFSHCSSLESVIISKKVIEVGFFAFEMCTNLTIYSEYNSKPASGSPGWHDNWNKESKPIVWGCTLSDGSSEAPYVVSVTKGASTIENFGTLNAPYREGAIFKEWNTDSSEGGTTYLENELRNVPDGTTVYAIYE